MSQRHHGAQDLTGCPDPHCSSEIVILVAREVLHCCGQEPALPCLVRPDSVCVPCSRVSVTSSPDVSREGRFTQPMVSEFTGHGLLSL